MKKWEAKITLVSIDEADEDDVLEYLAEILLGERVFGGDSEDWELEMIEKLPDPEWEEEFKKSLKGH